MKPPKKEPRSLTQEELLAELPRWNKDAEERRAAYERQQAIHDRLLERAEYVDGWNRDRVGSCSEYEEVHVAEILSEIEWNRRMRKAN